MAEAQKIKMYAHNACPQVPGVVGMLQQSRADYDYINIKQDDDAREWVREVNNGYESVPTLLFPDGSTLTEPSANELRDKLKAMGYTVPLHTLLLGNIHLIIAGLIVAFGVFRFLEII